MSNQTKSTLYLLLSGMLFGTFGIWIRILSKELTPFQQIALRNLISLLFALPLAFILKNNWGSLRKIGFVKLFPFAVFFPLSVIFFVFAMLYTKISIATFAFYGSSYIASLILGRVIFKDSTNIQKLVAIGLSFAGLYFLFLSGPTFEINKGVMFGLASGFLDSLNLTFIRKLASQIDRFVMVSIRMGSGFVIAIVFSFALGQGFPLSLSPVTILVALLFGALLTVVSLLTFVGFQHFDLNKGTIIMSSELIFAPAFAFIAFGEGLKPNDLWGGLLITTAIVVSNLDFKNFFHHNR